MPKRLRIFFRFHRRLLQQLPTLAWQSLLEVYRSVLGQDAAPGGILGVQTFGQLLHFHPHIHGFVTDGAFDAAGRFLPLPPNFSHQPFLRLWENKVFDLLLADGRIDSGVVAQVRSWRHSGFGVDRSVRLRAGDRQGIENLAQYVARSPFSLGRLVRVPRSGRVVYRAEKSSPQRFPEPGSAALLPGVRRNFHVFEPLDFLAELVQHIPDKGEHPIRYYGYYSNKARGMRARRAASQEPTKPAETQRGAPDQTRAARDGLVFLRKRCWAMLIKHVYQVDPLRCPRCGGTMKIIAFIEAHQADLIRKILEHCGLWKPPPSPPPPISARPPTAADATAPDSGVTYEPDPDFLEHTRREQMEQPELPWDA
jgi:hypothetical protein